jgi:hypothetical protein
VGLALFGADYVLACCYVSLHICNEAACTAFILAWFFFVLESDAIQLRRGRVSANRSHAAGLPFRCRKVRYCVSCCSRWLLGVGVTHALLQRSRILWWQRKWAHVIPSLRRCFVNLVCQVEIDNVGWQIFVNILICTHGIAGLGTRSLLGLSNVFFYFFTLADVGSSFCLTVQCVLVAVLEQVTALPKI